jgi:CDP-diacylglycerol--glycerol-3-phosphate 3-phosphatidyltransferase
MPLPWFLVYQGQGARVAAVIILFILGFTDYFDGLLARKYGTTPLGRLLDPIADKIFVAVTLIPLLHLGILPLWVVWPIFLREFVVTELRRFLTPGRDELKVTELAKIKTTVQMTGIGLIFLTATFPDKSVSFFLIYLAMAGTACGMVWMWLRQHRVPARLWIAMGFLLAGLLPLLVFSTETTNVIYGAVLLGITLASGAQYVRATLPMCIKRGVGAVAGLVLSVAMPLALLAVLPGVSQTMAGIITLVVAVEFCSQGMDMWAVQQGHRTLTAWKERLFVPAAFLSPLYGWASGAQNVIQGFIITACVVSLAYTISDIVFLRDLLFGKNSNQPEN